MRIYLDPKLHEELDRIFGHAYQDTLPVNDDSARRDWSRYNGQDAELSISLERNPGIETPTEECPECWGTGYAQGFGAACSHGCKDPTK